MQNSIDRPGCIPLKNTLAQTLHIPLCGIIDSLNADPPYTSYKRKQPFNNVPFRYSDIIHDRWMSASLITEYTLNVNDGVTWTMILQDQFSPPRELIMGSYQWSILRFVLCSLDRNVVYFSFQVNTPDVDVGREGPFSVLLLNESKSIAACCSSRHKYCVVFPVPELSSTIKPIFGSTFCLSAAVIVAKWHPYIDTLLLVFTEHELVVIDAAQAHTHYRSVQVSNVADFVFIPSLTSSKKSTQWSISILVLKKDGSIHLLVVHLKSGGTTCPSELFVQPHLPSALVQSPSLQRYSSMYSQYYSVKDSSKLTSNGDSLPTPPQDPPWYSEVILIGEDEEHKTYTSLVILHSDFIFVMGRLAATGKFDVLGVDISFEYLERRILLNKSLKDFSSFILHSIQLPLHVSVAPRIYVEPSRRPNLNGKASCCCPYIIIMTPQSLVLVEFPWLLQIEAFSETRTKSLFLLPTHVDILTPVPEPQDSENSVTLILGVFLIPAHTVDRGPRYVSLQCKVTLDSQILSLSSEETQWIVCEKWELLSVSLCNKLTTNGLLRRLERLLTDAWEILSPNETDATPVTHTAPSQPSTYQERLLGLNQAIHGISPTNVDKDKMCILQKVTPKETVHHILTELGVASLKLWKMMTLKKQLERLHVSLVNVDLKNAVQEVVHTNEGLTHHVERITQRILSIQKKHAELLDGFRCLLVSNILPLADNYRQRIVIDDIVPMVKRAVIPAAFLLTEVIKSKADLIAPLLIDYLSVACKTAQRDSQFSNLKLKFLHQRVEHMVIELGAACEAFINFSSQIDVWLLNNQHQLKTTETPWPPVTN